MSNSIKKAFLFLTIIFSCFFISNFALANNDVSMEQARNGIRNVVGGAENVVENAAKDTTSTVKNGLEGAGNVTQNTMHNVSASRTSTDSGTATRAVAPTSDNNNTMWTWFIVGIIAIVIIGVIWYMASRNNNSSNR